MKLYASLIGPLLGYYYPMPKEFESHTDPELVFRKALSSSRLKTLWHSIYSEAETLGQIDTFGGKILEPMAPLDYSQGDILG